MILFRVPPAASRPRRTLDAASAAGPGWSCFGGTGLPTTAKDALQSLDNSPWIAAWAPGWGSDHAPDGVGIPLAAGSQVVMQVHYNLLNGRKPDLSKAVLTTVPASAALKPLETMLLPAPVEVPCAQGESGPLCDRGAAIAEGLRKYGPAGYAPLGLLYLCGKNVQAPPTGPTTSCDRPHLDARRRSTASPATCTCSASRSGSSSTRARRARRCCSTSRDWDFHWQTVYTLASRSQAAPATSSATTCVFDTTKRRNLTSKAAARTPKYIVWGEGTTDEMCLGLLQVTRG